jgi:chaperonin GroES
MLKPLDNRVVLKRIAAEQKVGSIVVVKNAAEKPRGEVIEIGSGRLTSAGTFVPLQVARGDKVIFDEGAVQAVVKQGEEELLVVNADGLLAVVQ